MGRQLLEARDERFDGGRQEGCLVAALLAVSAVFVVEALARDLALHRLSQTVPVLGGPLQLVLVPLGYFIIWACCHPTTVELTISAADETAGPTRMLVPLMMGAVRNCAGGTTGGYIDTMAGASESTLRVRYVNMNWEAGADGEDGTFSVLVVTEDDERHMLTPSPAAAQTLVALSQASDVILWDPTNKTLIAANLVGRWIQQDWRAGDRRDGE